MGLDLASEDGKYAETLYGIAPDEVKLSETVSWWMKVDMAGSVGGSVQGHSPCDSEAQVPQRGSRCCGKVNCLDRLLVLITGISASRYPPQKQHPT